MDDDEPDCVAAMLEYLYCGKPGLLSNHYEEPGEIALEFLLKTADLCRKYDVQALATACEDQIRIMIEEFDTWCSDFFEIISLLLDLKGGYASFDILENAIVDWVCDERFFDNFVATSELQSLLAEHATFSIKVACKMLQKQKRDRKQQKDQRLR